MALRPRVTGAAWRKRQAWLTLGALGVVYGDIGTSPLYAVRQSVLATGGQMPMRGAVLGAISLILWSLIIIVTIKYIVFILRADNKGEGGVIALASLAHRSHGLSRRMKTAIGFAGVLGLALFFGDGMLTPAISVLSAVEGLKLENPAFGPLVLPITLVILLGLFLIQNRGTGKLGRLFGPIVLVWFVVLGRARPAFHRDDAGNPAWRSIRGKGSGSSSSSPGPLSSRSVRWSSP